MFVMLSWIQWVILALREENFGILRLEILAWFKRRRDGKMQFRVLSRVKGDLG
jgi:hypothetical protein